MPTHEYKVLPAPSKGRKGPGIKGAEARFAHALEALINEMAADGWYYQRSDMLPHEQRQGIRSSQTTYRSVLVFCREINVKDQEAEPQADETPLLEEDAEVDQSTDANSAPQSVAEEVKELEEPEETPTDRAT